MNNIPFLDQSTQLTCENCGSIYFQEAVSFKKVSKLLTGDAQDKVYPVPAMICVSCKTPHPDFMMKTS